MEEQPSGTPEAFSVDRVRSLVELMQEHDLREIDLQSGEARIRLRRGAEFVSAPVVAQPTAPAPVAAPAPPAGESAGPAAPEKTYITSPIVGTFYVAANPESDAFVKVGSSVTPDTVVCIVEAMKVFNEIPAKVTGTIAKCLVENGQPVEYGQPLFELEPN